MYFTFSLLPLCVSPRFKGSLALPPRYFFYAVFVGIFRFILDSWTYGALSVPPRTFWCLSLCYCCGLQQNRLLDGHVFKAVFVVYVGLCVCPHINGFSIIYHAFFALSSVFRYFFLKIRIRSWNDDCIIFSAHLFIYAAHWRYFGGNFAALQFSGKLPQAVGRL